MDTTEDQCAETKFS